MQHNLIVTFGCQKDVFVYTEKSGVKPMYPYRIHQSVSAAKKLLNSLGVKRIKIIEH